VTSEPSPTEENGHVVRFRPRGTPPWRWPVGRAAQHDPSMDELAKFERSDGEDDYRHRMGMNALALVATVLLVCAGVWLAIKITDMVRVQDCVLSGRRNCAPIEAGTIKGV
jgi:hypothetical protein